MTVLTTYMIPMFGTFNKLYYCGGVTWIYEYQLFAPFPNDEKVQATGKWHSKSIDVETANLLIEQSK